MAAKPARFSVLDQAPVAEGSTAHETLNRSVELARHAEALGFHRFWMSEHHAMEALACSAPEVVLSRIGASTSTIRIGSGGIMLPHYAPFKVAEVFSTLATMYPGRVDLGIGRAPGGGPIETRALQRDRSAAALRSVADDFPVQVDELRTWLGQTEPFDDRHPFRAVRVIPETHTGPVVWMLGSSLWGAAAASQWGLPYAYAHFFSPVHTREALENYRRTFHPSAQQAKPEAMAAVGVIVADTDEEAQYLAGSVRLLQRRIRMGDRRAVAPPEQAARELAIGPAEPEEGEFPRYFVGSPQTVRAGLSAMAESLQLDEVLVNTIVHSHAARLRSYTLLAEAFA